MKLAPGLTTQSNPHKQNSWILFTQWTASITDKTHASGNDDDTDDEEEEIGQKARRRTPRAAARQTARKIKRRRLIDVSDESSGECFNPGLHDHEMYVFILSSFGLSKEFPVNSQCIYFVNVFKTKSFLMFNQFTLEDYFFPVPRAGLFLVKN